MVVPNKPVIYVVYECSSQIWITPIAFIDGPMIKLMKGK